MPLGASRLGVAAGLAILIGTACVTSCAVGSTGASGAFEPRFVAVHNTLAAMGLAQVGPLVQGTLAEGREARSTLDLAAGCTTIVAVGADGVRDLDARLLDAQGQAVAHDTTQEPQAVLKVCVDAPGSYVLVVKVAAGAGSYVAAAWQGAGAPPAPSAVAQAAARQALGTCEAPIPLSAGTVSGSTARGEDANTGSCERSDARELVYELDVTQRERVSIDVEAHFDSILYIRKEACADADAEVDCNDDAPSSGRNHSRIERVLEPGKYFVFVDGYNQESGTFKLTLSTSDVVSLSDVCSKAPALLAGVTAAATTRGKVDDAEASCGGGAEGADAAWHLDLPSRSRVRLIEHSDEVSPVLHARRACTDEQSETACAESGAVPGDATITGTFDPGAYTVFADAREHGAAGSYSLLFESVPPEGLGVAGDGCGDALPLAPASTVTGDTFAARDDVAGSCGGARAADVVYHLDVPRRSRLLAKLDGEEGSHLLVAFRHCGDRASEVGCGKGIDEVVSPGSYFIAVDGASPDALGRFKLSVALQDLSGQSAACASAPVLVEGRTVSSSSVGMGDRFASSCSAGGDSSATGADRVFRLSVAAVSLVRVALVAQGFEATLSIRAACGDAQGSAIELGCEGDASETGHRITLERRLEPGTYYVVVDGQSPTEQGPFTLEYHTLSAR
jgi:hypothetical protein